MGRLYNILDKIATWINAPVEATTESTSVTIGANSATSFTIDMTKSGYTPVGMVGWYPTGSASGYCRLVSCYLSAASSGSGRVVGYVANQNSAQVTWTIAVKVLWCKLGGGTA